MNRREFIRGIGCGSTAWMLTSIVKVGFSRNTPSTRHKPNVMLVIGDDMTWRDCEPYGNREVKTPNMTRLAREGMCFDAMFTATAMCAPTRQQLYTGMFPVRNGAYPNHSRVYDGVKSLVHYLRDLDYRVGLIGKTHFNPPESYPFEFIGRKGNKKGATR